MKKSKLIIYSLVGVILFSFGYLLYFLNFQQAKVTLQTKANVVSSLNERDIAVRYFSDFIYPNPRADDGGRVF
jgi:hypothetical protein